MKGMIHPRACISRYLVIVCAGVLLGQSRGYSTEQSVIHLLDQDLAWIQAEAVLYTASRREESLFRTPAAAYVIDQDDIRRSGATSIPDLLRTVPGLQVARIDASNWAITARGFNRRFANKLLVMIDGRSIYNPLFSGVFWDAKDTLLRDIERIEIIRGPGAALWGANAVNGVINIVTKSAMQTSDNFIEAGSGDEERGFVGIRHGDRVNENLAYRIYGKYSAKDHFVLENGRHGGDDWYQTRGGFRLDWSDDDSNSLSLHGDIYSGTSGQTTQLNTLSQPRLRIFDDQADHSGGNIVAGWEHRRAIDDGSKLQLYFDQVNLATVAVDMSIDTYEIDFQREFSADERHKIIWGLGYRLYYNHGRNKEISVFDPERRTLQLFSGFIQDTATLVDDQLYLILGSKFEHHDYTGFEPQPNLRLLWTPDETHTLWSSVSRSVRTPNYIERDARLNTTVITNPGLLPVVQAFFGDSDFDSEKLIAYELGYRTVWTTKLTLDVAVFFNDYDDLMTAEPGIVFPENSPLPNHLVAPLSADNNMTGETYGFELGIDWRLGNSWRFRAGYTYLEMNLHLDSNSLDFASELAEGQNPEQQMFIQNSINLTENLEFDITLRYVGGLASLNIDSYTNLDIHLSWRPSERVELSVVGQNLIDGEHLEIRPAFIQNIIPSEIERSIYGKIAFQF